MAGTQVETLIDPMEAFKERIQAKVREDIAELLPDEAIQGLVDSAVRHTFFEPRKVDHGYGKTELKPSWFVEEVAKAAEPAMRRAVEAYVKKNRGAIKRAMDEFLATQNLTLITIAAMRQATNDDIREIAQEIITRMRSGV